MSSDPDTHEAEARTRHTRRAAPLLVLGGVVAAALAARVASDAGLEVLPPCPFHAATGLDCPGCGATRALIALTRLDVLAALDHNVLLVVLLGALAVGWPVRALLRRAVVRRGGADTVTPVAPAAPRLGWLLPSLVTVTLLFGVVRNLPGVPFLGADAG